jgi:TolA-binding protein
LDFNKAYQYYLLNESLAQDQGEKYQAQLGALRSAFKLSKDSEVIAYGKKVAESINATATERGSAYYYMGKTHYKLNDLVSANTAFSQVERYINNSQAAEARYMLAEILFKQGKITEAQKAAESANEKNGSYSYWIAKGLLLQSDTYVIENDFLNARAAVEAVIENFKDDASILTIAKEKLEEIKKKEAAGNRIKPNSNSLEVITPKKN